MKVIEYTDTPRDFYGHLPTLAEWVFAASTDYTREFQEVESRIRMAAAATQALPVDKSRPEPLYVGYAPSTDTPFFLRKMDSGYIHVAYPADNWW